MSLILWIVVGVYVVSCGVLLFSLLGAKKDPLEMRRPW